jgi:hypothetical protein
MKAASQAEAMSNPSLNPALLRRMNQFLPGAAPVRRLNRWLTRECAPLRTAEGPRGLESQKYLGFVGARPLEGEAQLLNFPGGGGRTRRVST